MSGITLTPVVAESGLAGSVGSLASGGAGFGDALEVAMSQLSGAAVTESVLNVSDSQPVVASVADSFLQDKDADEPEKGFLWPLSAELNAHLMQAMVPLAPAYVANSTSDGSAATDSPVSLSAGGGSNKLGRMLALVVDRAVNHDAGSADLFKPVAEGDGVSLGGWREESFAAILQELPPGADDLPLVMADSVQPQAGSSLQVQAGVIEVRQQEGHKVMVISTPVNSAAWADELGNKTLIMVSEGQHSAEMQLNPPNLGPLEVRLSVHDDQASLLFVSAQASVREAIQSALPRLSAMLAESGLSMGDVQVGGESLTQQNPSRDGGANPQRRIRLMDEDPGVADVVASHRSGWRVSMFV